MMWPHQKSVTILILMPLACFFALSLDLYIPAIPLIQEQLHTSKSMMNLTCSLFMLCCSIGQIVFGPLSDRYGRKSLILVCLALLLISNMLCMRATHITLLIFARILQAIGCCGTYLASFAIVRDIYDDPQVNASMYSYLNMSISFSPLFAPTTGAVLCAALGWPSVFIALTILTVAALVMVYYSLPETARIHLQNKSLPPIHHQAHHLPSLIHSYRRVLRSSQFQIYTFIAGVGMSCFYAFYTIYPYIIQRGLGIPTAYSGFGYGMVGLAYLLGSLCSGQISPHLRINQMIAIGIMISSSGALAMLVAHQWIGLSFLGFITPMMLVVFGAAFMLSAGMAGTMQPFGDIAGVAFAAIGSYKFLFCAAVGSLVMLFPTTPTPLAIIMLCFNLSNGLLLWLGSTKLTPPSSPEPINSNPE